MEHCIMKQCLLRPCLQVMHLLCSLIERASESMPPHVAMVASALPQVLGCIVGFHSVLEGWMFWMVGCMLDGCELAE